MFKMVMKSQRHCDRMSSIIWAPHKRFSVWKIIIMDDSTCIIHVARCQFGSAHYLDIACAESFRADFDIVNSDADN